MQWDLKLYKGFILKFYSYLYNVSSCEGSFKNKVLIFNRETFFFFILQITTETLYSERDWNEIKKDNMFYNIQIRQCFPICWRNVLQTKKKDSTGEKYLRNTEILQCRRFLSQLSHKGIPRILEWVAYPFSSRSSQRRNWTGVSCIAGKFFTNWAIREAHITYIIYLFVYHVCVCVCVCFQSLQSRLTLRDAMDWLLCT